jgi:hypothetical protein
MPGDVKVHDGCISRWQDLAFGLFIAGSTTLIDVTCVKLPTVRQILRSPSNQKQSDSTSIVSLSGDVDHVQSGKENTVSPFRRVYTSLDDLWMISDAIAKNSIQKSLFIISYPPGQPKSQDRREQRSTCCQSWRQSQCEYPLFPL